MNFSSQLNKAITTVLHSYIEEISIKYNIDKSELINLWDGQSETKNKEVKSNTKNSEVKDSSENQLLNRESLNKLTVPGLKTMLSNKGLKVSGTKLELIDRLLASSENSQVNDEVIKNKESNKNTLKTPISQPIFQLRRNNFGN
jgi:hypothetical protein